MLSRSVTRCSTKTILLRPFLKHTCSYHKIIGSLLFPKSKNWNRNVPSYNHWRMLTTPPPLVNESLLSMEEYHRQSDGAMENLLHFLEELLEEKGNPNHEVDYHSGVLTLNLGNRGTYVINKQPPNKQIWLSSPVSGPKRYDYDTNSGRWVYSRDNTTLDSLLSEELSDVYSHTVKILL